jgi:alkanesulfonate monooxygenase SsuD/methylene tetrahydromethanopterin reductase-like flavin-dependent oxidoreductase (luciferase family)
MDAPFRIAPTRIAPIPPEPVDVWIGGAAAPAVDRAARLGDAFLIGPEATPDEARRLVADYRERRAAHGLTPGRIAIRRDVHVAGSRAEHDAVARPVIERGYRGFDPSAIVAGETGAVVDRFGELAAMGCDDVIVRHLADDHAAVLASFERLASVRAALVDL